MITANRIRWLIPSSLIALSIIPVLAGFVRIAQLGSGVEITAENARFVAAPLIVIGHILAASIFCVLGAFQFESEFRRRHPGWHRQMGRLLVPVGLIAALTGLWLSQARPPATMTGAAPADFDGAAVYAQRLIVGVAMAASLGLGLTAVLQRNFRQHQNWMMRAYALGLGAGTQVFTHLPWFLFPGIRGELARAVFMGSGWLINVVVAEWLIRKRPPRRSANGAPSGSSATVDPAHVQTLGTADPGELTRSSAVQPD